MRALSSHRLASFAAVAGALALPAAGAALPVADYTQPAARDTEPIILTGKDFPDWGARANVTAKAPLTDLPCQGGFGECEHNNYAEPEVDSGNAAGEGTPVDRLLGYRWDGTRFVQIPFQVDEMFTRYLDNGVSGFAFYSGQDQHTSYAFNREGFRFTEDGPADNPCLAQAAGGQETTPDPVAGLDDNDELVFMASDAGPAAPAGARLPQGVEELRRVEITDPTAPGDPTDPESVRAVYVAKAAPNGATPAFDADNGYVRYERDANAGLFEFSQSSYRDYGNAAVGTYCDADGNPLGQGRRRPRDYATVTTDRYRFRYDGRWLMTKLEISPDGGRTFGPDLIDRWKARAFQQDPSSETPCCGYEEEDTNWGGSSTLLGERWGPVRAIRETWGADSGTNVIRRETFYRDEIRQKNFLRVHVIPPLDGIYAQWDFNAGAMTRFYNSSMSAAHAAGQPVGVDIDGRNDEVFGNLDDPCNSNYTANDTGDLDQQYRTVYSAIPGLCSQLLPNEACMPFDPALEELNNFLEDVPQGPEVPRPCGQFPYHQSIDLSDPTMSEANAGNQWNVTSGPYGTVVDRYQIDDVTDQSAGGLAQSVFAVPYYRDDSCFDDGTGTNPGPKIKLRSGDEPRTYPYPAPEGVDPQPRECWTPEDGTEDLWTEDRKTQRFYQGSIGTHGLHILMIAESDNARMTVPVTEMVAEQRMVMLPGQQDITAGERYGRGFEKPLVAVAVPVPEEYSDPNQPPTASFEYTPAAPHTGRPVTFDSTSADADGGIDKLEWDLDGDGQFDDAEGDQVTHTFTTVDDDHSVGLRATDTSGDTATEYQSIAVTNPAPTGSISYTPASPRPREAVTLTGTGSDENGSVTGFAWDLDSDGAFDDGSSAQVSRSFPTPGNYPVALRLTDNDGASTVVQAVVRVGKGGKTR